MKTIKLLTVFFVAVLLNSCSSGNSGENHNESQSVEGAWRLTNVKGGITGINDNFPDGSITWTFHNDGTINVLNTNTDDSKQDLIETGNYTYGFVPNTTTPQSCPIAIVVNGVSY